jgi:hypothetical protein
LHQPGQGTFSPDLSRGTRACEITRGSVTLDDLARLGPGQDLARMDALLKASCAPSTPYSGDRPGAISLTAAITRLQALAAG